MILQVLYVPVKLDESAELDSPVGSPGESSQASAAAARASDQHSDLSDQLASITRPRSPSSPVSVTTVSLSKWVDESSVAIVIGRNL